MTAITGDPPQQHPGRTPALERWDPPSGDGAPTVGAVLTLHGGRVKGRRPVGRLDLPMLRMHAIASAAHDDLAARGVVIWSLRYAVQGWNGTTASPVADAQWALARIAATDDVPVALLGHSMGGRTAMRVAGEANVAGVVALAPWFPPGEPLGEVAGRRLVIAHGTRDHTTDPRASRRYADDAERAGAHVRFVDVPGEGHALLRRAAWWNRFAAESVLDVLGRPTS